MTEWADDPGSATWQRATCSNEECGHTQDVRVVVQYGCAVLDRSECDDCGAPLELEGD